MASPARRPVLWSHGARNLTPPPARRDWRSWLARLGLLGAAVAALLGWLQVPWFWPERVQADVILVVNAPTKAVRRHAEELANQLRGHPGVGRVVVEPPEDGAGDCRAETVLDKLLATPHAGPRLVLLIHPATAETDADAWAKRAARCRASGLSVAALVLPPESLPGAVATLPRRQIERDGGRGGTFSILLRNLDQLDAAAPAVVELIAHGSDARFHLPALETAFQAGGVALDADRSEPRRAYLKVDLKKLAPNAGRTVMLYPIAHHELLAGRWDGLEVVLHADNRVVSRSFTAIDSAPPRGLYVPLAAMLHEKTTGRFQPRLPQTPGAATGASDRLPWNLLWLPDKGPVRGGVRVWWPPHRRPLESGATIEHLPATAADLTAYRFVILDASAVPGLDADFHLRGSTGQAGKEQHAWTEAGHAGGFIGDPRASPVDPREWQTFLAALRQYWHDGGCVLLVGNNPQCFAADLELPGVDPVNFVNFRTLLQSFDPILADLNPVGLPRRLLLAFEDTETAATQLVPTLAPLPNAPHVLPADVEVALQALTFFGVPPERLTETTWQLPGRTALTKRTAQRLGLLQDATAGDQEFANLLRDLVPDSLLDLELCLVEALLARFNHPGWHVELQGQPAFRRGYPSRPLTGPLTPELAQLPFAYQKEKPGAWYGNRYTTLFRRLANQGGKLPPDWPLLAGGNLVDGLNFERFTQYLREQTQGDAASAARQDLVVALFSRKSAEAAGARAEHVTWPLIAPPDAPLPFPREKRPLEPAALAPGQHFLFFGPGNDDHLAALVAHRFLGAALSPDAWRDVRLAPGPGTFHQRLLFMGRGRVARLLELALARDVQALACRTDPTLARDWVALQGTANPEAVDLLRRIVHERLRLSLLPTVAPGEKSRERWKPLVKLPVGDKPLPVVLAAASPNPSPLRPAGRLFLVQMEPLLEVALHELRNQALCSWVDFSATTTFVEGKPREAPCGVRLATRLAGAGTAGLRCRLTAHGLTPASPVPWLEKAARAGVEVEVEVTARSHLGLAGANQVKLAVDPVAGQPGVFTLAAGGGSPRTLTLPADGVDFVLTEGTVDFLTGALGAAPQSAPFPQSLPLLLEFRLKMGGAQPYDGAVFAPIPPQFTKAQEQQAYFAGSLQYAAPAAQCIDLILDLASDGDRCYRVEPLSDGTSLRIVPLRPRLPPPTAANLTVVADTEGTPAVTGWLVDGRFPGQAVMHWPSPARAPVGRVRVRIRQADGREEEHGLFLPGGPRPWVLQPAESGAAAPRPGELILDTLTLGTMPEALRHRLDDPGATVSWQAAARGLLVAPLSPGQTDAPAAFARTCVEMRTETAHSRLWYLVALTAMAGAMAVMLARSR
jgi:hypothetical protein